MLVSLRAHNGQYLAAEENGGGAVNANRDRADVWERFRLLAFDNDTVAFVTGNRYVLGTDVSLNRLVATEGNLRSPGRVFTLEGAGSGHVAIRTPAGRYVSADQGGGGHLEIDRASIGPWERFRLYEWADGRPPVNGAVEAAEERPFAGNFLGPLKRDTDDEDPITNGYFGPALPSWPEGEQHDYLDTYQAAGGRTILLYAEWKFREKFRDNGWAGPKGYNAFDGDMQAFVRVCQRCVDRGLSTWVVMADSRISIKESVDRLDDLVDVAEHLISGYIPRLEADEQYNRLERAQLMQAYVDAGVRTALHTSPHLGTDEEWYEGIPVGVPILGQVPRQMPAHQLERFCRARADAAAVHRLVIINAEHSAPARLSAYSWDQAKQRALACMRGGWRESFNHLSREVLVLSNLWHRRPTPESLEQAFPELQHAVPGVEIVGSHRDKLRFDDGTIVDVIHGSSTPTPGPWQWLVAG